MINTRVVTLSDFAVAVPGKIFVIAALHFDEYDWVQVVKRDLVGLLRAKGHKWLEIDDNESGKVYVHGVSKDRRDLE